MMRWAKILVMALLLGGAAGCATTGPMDQRDPLEGYNRAIFSFNEGFDQVFMKPVATVYRDALPDPVRGWVRNFFANIADLLIGFNNLLQGKPADTVTDWARFAFNTTLGVFGLNDVATTFGLEKHDEDFGQTFGRWGMDEGAYIVWPFIGSSSMRDSLGLIPDLALDPVVRHRPVDVSNTLLAIRFTSRRADLLDASRILEEAALDKYVFQRDAYLQRRRSLVYDGNPPRAERETPRADAESPPAGPASASDAAPVAQPVSAAPAEARSENLGAAVQLLEDPASHHAATGGG
jgi:phospholipid-binding lipoprotein MlaA